MMRLAVAPPCIKDGHYRTFVVRLEGEILHIQEGLNSIGKIELIKSKLITNFAVCINKIEEYALFIFTIPTAKDLYSIKRQWTAKIVGFHKAMKGKPPKLKGHSLEKH
jgi:hypothetical protein